MNNSNGQGYALVTGATSGIGKEIAKLFAEDGINLVLVARTESDLQQTASELQNTYGIKVQTLAKDLFFADAAQEIYDAVKQMGINIKWLVNDAGQGEWGPFTEIALERTLDIIQLNIVSLVSLTKLFLKDMTDAGEGRILMLASVASKNPSPLLSIYAATKAFVYSFAIALHEELKDTGVTVTALLPGATDTDFFNKAGAEHTKEYKPEDMSDPADVAKDGYKAMMAGESKVISGFKNKASITVGNVTPDETLAKRMHSAMEDKSK